MEGLKMASFKGTTIVAVRKDGKVAIAGDGQVTYGNTVLKGNAHKIRHLFDGKVVTGFAGTTADAFTLFELFEVKLKQFHGDLTRAAVELAKQWRTDKQLRQLEAMLLVTDGDKILLLNGAGDVVEPEHDVMGIGSGGNFALSAALAYLDADTGLSAREIAVKSVKIASTLCIYTDDQIIVEELTK
jgi:ATP-dependent HslUV protease subunit HslV